MHIHSTNGRGIAGGGYTTGGVRYLMGEVERDTSSTHCQTPEVEVWVMRQVSDECTQ